MAGWLARLKAVPDPSDLVARLTAVPDPSVRAILERKRRPRLPFAGAASRAQLTNTLINASQMPINAAAEMRPAQIGSAPSTQILLAWVPGVL